MRVASLGVARPLYYDRAATTASAQYSNTLAPHAFTTRFTYTVPAGYKAYVENSYCLVVVKTAGSAVGDVYSGVGAITDDATSSYVANAQIYTLTQGVSQESLAASVALLNAGNQLLGYTINLCTGGTVLHTLSIKYSQFSA